MSSSSEKMITLRSTDGETFEVEESVAAQSQTIRFMIEDGFANGVIPLQNVSSDILSKVIEYCKKHIEYAAATAAEEDPSAQVELARWDSEFVNADHGILADLIMAASYLNIKGLLDLTCQTVAGMLEEKSPQEARKMFGIENDFTPEEEAKVAREEWVEMFSRRSKRSE